MQLGCFAFAHVRTFSGCRGFREHTQHVDIIRFVRLALHPLATPVPTKVARVVTETSAHAATVNTGSTDTLQKLHKQKNGPKEQPTSAKIKDDALVLNACRCSEMWLQKMEHNLICTKVVRTSAYSNAPMIAMMPFLDARGANERQIDIVIYW